MLWHHWHGFPAWPGSGAVSVSFITISGAQRLAHTKTTQTTVGQSRLQLQSTNESLSHRQRINTKMHVFIRSLDISTHSWIHYGMQQFLLNYTMILDTYSRPPNHISSDSIRDSVNHFHRQSSSLLFCSTASRRFSCWRVIKICMIILFLLQGLGSRFFSVTVQCNVYSFKSCRSHS